ncbi:MAG: hypothetical protein IJ225_01410 [Solobacterium sp.]|nr:hypothetical protein [Solobacterium sp.]
MRLKPLIYTAVLSLLFAGCAPRYGANIQVDTSGSGIGQVLEERMEEETKVKEVSEAEVHSTALASTSYDLVDVDLTGLSSTMVYAEVYNIVMNPDEYMGKVICMDGMYTEFYNEALDVWYFSCIIQDALACCAQGIEFVLTEDYIYPENYPTEGDYIIVTGIFDRYEENGFPYYTLREAVLSEA